MPVDTYQSSSFMIDQFLAWQGITPSGTATQRADALTKLNIAYQEFMRGTYVNERGEQSFHNWSFIHETETDLTISEDTREVTLPTDFVGIIEDIVFEYDGTSSKAGLQIKKISAHAMQERMRDTNTSGTPSEWCVRLGSYAVGTGSVYQLVVNPAPLDGDMDVVIRYRFKPAPLTDSTSVYPVGPVGAADCIVQLAKSREERTRGQTEGPEWREANRQLNSIARLDQEVYPEGNQQESLADFETGLSD